MSKFKLSQAARVANISFEGTDFDGLEIKARLDLPMKIVLEIQRLVASEKTEDSILGSLFNNVKGKTIITISHRKNSLKNFDKIFDIKNGILHQID